MDVAGVSGWAWPTGIGVLVVAIRFLYPLIRSSTDTFVARNGTESGILNQMALERDKAIARADAADARADKYFMDLADMKTQVQLLSWQLKIANEKIDVLIKQTGNP